MKLKEIFEAQDQKTYRVVLTRHGKVEMPPMTVRGFDEKDATDNILNTFKMAKVAYIEPWDTKQPGVFKVGDKVIFVKPSERIRMRGTKLDSYGNDNTGVDKKDDVDMEGVVTRISPHSKFADVDFNGNGLSVNPSDLRLKI